MMQIIMISMMINDDEKDNHHHDRIIRVDEGHSLDPTNPTIASGHVDNHGAFEVFALIIVRRFIIFLVNSLSHCLRILEGEMLC